MGNDSVELSTSIVDTIGFKPKWIKQPVSWAGHLHFANFLIYECRPNIFVELGTHSGNSYFSFCQAVKELGVSTKCYAVDTWVGDLHAGTYENDVYEEVKENNDQYSNFSTLLRMTFDSAVNEFKDKSIDLLHIDGLHTYEAVKHDFETWFPKLSENAIVLFHDTQVFSGEFGVWKLWEELKNSYSFNLEFIHSNGLGILCINNNLDEKIFKWLRNSIEKENIALKYFSEVGGYFYEKENLIITRQKLEQQIIDLKNEINNFHDLNLITQNLRKDLRIASAKIYDTKNQVDRVQVELVNIRNSISWKVTTPIREVKRWLNNPKQQINRYLEYAVYSPKISLPVGIKNKILKYLDPDTSTNNEKLFKSEGKKFIEMLNECSELLKLETLSVDQKIEVLKLRLNELDSTSKLASSPLVSIIIPVYGKIEYTLLCLLSIFNNLPKNSFEIIIVNDCSLDSTREILESFKWVHLMNNVENKGFILSCNAGASLARGKYLYFLNNDVEVLFGWLDELVNTFENFPGTGLVGSKLIYPNGLLQEAGGIVWSDGSAWNFGRTQNPLEPVYSYAREVDYCSGASIMIPKDIYNSLGGFDEYFTPAYYEDVDIAFKLRERGYRVIYQPLSVVIHHEGVTSGTDLKSGVKAYQEINKVKFFQRWERRLKNHQLPGKNLDDAKDKVHQHRMLVIDNNTIAPDEDAGSLLIFNICMLLRELGFQVTFIPSSAMVDAGKSTKRLQKIGVEVIYVPYVKNIEEHLALLGARYEVAMLVRPDCVMNVVELVKKYCTNAKLIYHTIDLHFMRMMREGILKSSDSITNDALKMKSLEFKAVNEADVTIAVTNNDANILLKEMPDKNIFTLGLILDMSKNLIPFEGRDGIVFVGGFAHAPNKDAVLYFIYEVMPLLLKYHPSLIFTIIGSNIPDEILALESKNIHILGYVDNLNEILSRKLVNIAPLRFGAGIKGKIAGAMSIGLPSVVSPIAAEGMSLVNSENVLIADQPHEIARAIDSLLRDRSLWNKISINSITHAESLWGAKYASSELKKLFASIGIPVQKSPHNLKLYDDSLA